MMLEGIFSSPFFQLDQDLRSIKFFLKDLRVDFLSNL